MNQETSGRPNTSGESSGNIVNIEAKQVAMRDHFLGWQCRIRQLAMRNADGRPTSGMRPSLMLGPDNTSLGRITTLIVKTQPQGIAAQFRHMVRKTHDPAERRASALRFLASAYYQRSKEFSDDLTALFGANSEIAVQLLRYAQCRLDFSQYNQSYLIPFTVQKLAQQDPVYQVTYWHNSLFNARLPGDVQILRFRPDWMHAEAKPAVN